jgi:signal transduction histidine kinase
MKEMLHSLLEVYKFENGIIKLNPCETDIDKLIRLCIKENINLARSKNIEIEYLNTNNCRFLFADKYLIRRMLENLLNNGINYAFKNTKLTVTLTGYKNKIILKVKNEGYIIPEDIKKHIFDKYISGSHLNRKAGIGLGLYYCKRAAEVHGGNINLRTDNNISEFIIELEIQPDFSQNHNLKFV